MNFQVLIDTCLVDLGIADGIDPSNNKSLVSLVNDFEETAWRHDNFNNFIWDNIADTALTHREREALKRQPHSTLVSAAKNLRLTDAKDDIGQGSELAEIVLYGIMKHKYKALPVVPKIFYKQNTQDYAKGADSVHIVLESSGDFSLWFGESKFYNSIEDVRLADIIKSVKNSLAKDKLKKENSIILNVSELDHLDIDGNTRELIKDSLKPTNSIDSLKSKINVPILLLHECNITSSATECSEKYISEIKNFHKSRAQSYFKSHLNTLKSIHKYGDIKFHLILFPVPKKKPIVDRFVKFVGQFRE
ncbi:MAG TPA: DUF1837 domain-containing protein [Planctomicrobium sp.]|nr:DUF1837 domain-containing protein [Planctomicrobium sp.]